MRHKTAKKVSTFFAVGITRRMGVGDEFLLHCEGSIVLIDQEPALETDLKTCCELALRRQELFDGQNGNEFPNLVGARIRLGV